MSLLHGLCLVIVVSVPLQAEQARSPRCSILQQKLGKAKILLQTVTCEGKLLLGRHVSWGQKQLRCLSPRDSEHISIRKDPGHCCAAFTQPPPLWGCSTFPRGTQVLTWRHSLLKYQQDHLVHLLAKLDIFGRYRQKDK